MKEVVQLSVHGSAVNTNTKGYQLAIRDIDVALNLDSTMTGVQNLMN